MLQCLLRRGSSQFELSEEELPELPPGEKGEKIRRPSYLIRGGGDRHEVVVAQLFWQI